jgi:hypothetical protein
MKISTIGENIADTPFSYCCKKKTTPSSAQNWGFKNESAFLISKITVAIARTNKPDIHVSDIRISLMHRFKC